MVSTRSMTSTGRLELLAVAAVVVGQYAQAGDILMNPFTPGGDIIPLNANHPAFGSEAPRESLSYQVVTNSTDSDKESREATSSYDIDRIETFFKKAMVVNYQQLTQYSKGAAVTAPWPSSYWPIYEDGINYVWNPKDAMPPSEKYARAYGLDPVAFTTKVSQTSGILSQSTRPACKSDADCAKLKDGSGCGKRKGQATGNCIPKWFGVCHAWAPAAIEEREPRCPVTKNGVTFQAFDIKALITQVYDGSSLGTVFTGSRFNGPDTPASVDNFGRYKDETRRDIGPGFFHIAIHNIMGARKNSFIVDVDAASQVWNQPVRSYEVISATELTPESAAQVFFSASKWSFNTKAVKIMFIQLKFNYIVEAAEDGPLVSTNRVDSYTTSVYYEYCLELDAAGNIIGGEWVRNSRTEHPDFLWFPESTPTMESVSDIGIKYKEVRELLDASADCKAIDPAGSEASTVPTPSAPTVTTVPAASVPVATTTPAATVVVVPVPAASVVMGTTAPAPADGISAGEASAAPTPASSGFSIGTVTSASSLSEAYNAIAEMLKKWMEGRGRGN